MAAFLTDKKETYKNYEFTVDTVADISSLPTTSAGGSNELAYITDPIKPGSTAFVIATSAVYMLNGSGEWVAI